MNKSVLSFQTHQSDQSGSILLFVILLIPLLAIMIPQGFSRLRATQKVAYSSRSRGLLSNRILNLELNMLDTVMCSKTVKVPANVAIPKKGESPIPVTIANGIGAGQDLTTFLKSEGFTYEATFEPTGNYNGINPLLDGTGAPFMRAGRKVRYQMGKLVINATRNPEVSGEFRYGTPGAIRQEIPLMMIVNDSTLGAYQCTTRYRYLYDNFLATY